jgi:tetratricopeptide (TPR) repeat protein
MANKMTVLWALMLLLCSCGNKSKEQKTETPKPVGVLIEEAYKNGDWDKIISIGDTIIGDDAPMNIAIAYAEALAAKGNNEKAIKVLDKKILTNPDDYYLYNTKGNVYYIAEKYDSAIYYYDKTTEMKPSYARPYICKGEIYEYLEDKQMAIANYSLAVRLFAANGFVNEVQELCNRILSLDSTNVEAKGYLEQIQGEVGMI